MGPLAGVLRGRPDVAAVLGAVVDKAGVVDLLTRRLPLPLV